MGKSGRRSLNIDPNFVYCPHWRKAGCLAEADIGIFGTMLKGEICSGDYLSIKIGIWKCSVMRYSIALSLLLNNEIWSEYARYTKKSL